ncbi:MAG TPA: CRISPR-associated endonuclease Cas2 [Acidobacteriota bacterium]|nr:CRISPR-associated endonuclease Cas2 [bacterium]HNX20497.1 CRISPR-associated endonuclease Cas2 [Acidobacteriota bacterium]
MSVIHVVVSYDVVKDRRRNRVSKALKAHLERVQKSVFEGEVTPKRLEAIRRLMAKLIDPETDSVRIYQLCARCVPALEIVGCGTYVEAPDEDVMV